MKNKLCFLAVVALGLLPGAAATIDTADDLDAKIAQLSKKGTTAKDVLRVLGEPESYLWGDKTFTKSNLYWSALAAVRADQRDGQVPHTGNIFYGDV